MVIIRHSTTWLPIVLAFVALATMVIDFSIFGVPHYSADEGTAAHLFQLWLLLEVVLVGLFGVKQLPKSPKQTARMLIVQIAAIAIACSPVLYFHL